MSDERKPRGYGEGRIFRQKRKLADGTVIETGPYWISYCRRGKEIRESTKTLNERSARQFLKRRLDEIKRPVFIGPSEQKLGIEDLEKKILADYEKQCRKSVKSVKFRFKRLKAFFTFDRLTDITPSRIERYQSARLAEGARRATINRECAYLRRGFKLLFEAGEISTMPAIKLLSGENVRQGFIEKADFDKLLTRLPSDDDRDIIGFLYHSGWRSGEAKSLEWRDVDADIIRLRPENSKNGKPRLLPLIGEVKEIIERRRQKRLLSCLYVFHRKGKQIRSFLKAWRKASKEIEQPHLVPHDMRRSAVRNFRKAGLSENEGMMLSGHKTNSVYRRYDIIDEQDLRESMAKVQDHLARQNSATVVPMKAKK